MAAINGQNILVGMALGAASGALFGWATHSFWGTVGAGFAGGAMNSAVYGGDILRGAVIGGVTAGIGYGMGYTGSGLHGFGQGVFAALSGGVVGGLSSVAMGGSFGEGFKIGFICAGLSYAGNEIAGAIDQAVQARSSSEANNKTATESLDPLRKWLQKIQIESRREVKYAIAQVSDNLTLAAYELGSAIDYAGTTGDFSRFLKEVTLEGASSSMNSSLYHYIAAGLVKNNVIEVGHTHPRETEYGIFMSRNAVSGKIEQVSGPKPYVQTFSDNEYDYFKAINRVPVSWQNPEMTLRVSLIPGSRDYAVYIP